MYEDFANSPFIVGGLANIWQETWIPFLLIVIMCLYGGPVNGCELLAPYAVMHRNSRFLENQALGLDMAEAFWPRRHKCSRLQSL